MTESSSKFTVSDIVEPGVRLALEKELSAYFFQLLLHLKYPPFANDCRVDFESYKQKWFKRVRYEYTSRIHTLIGRHALESVLMRLYTTSFTTVDELCQCAVTLGLDRPKRYSMVRCG